MTDNTNAYPDLVNVEDWLNAKGYTGEAGACHQAMSLIRSQEKRIAALEAALKPFAYDYGDYSDGMWSDLDYIQVSVGDLRAARAAYKGEKE